MAALQKVKTLIAQGGVVIFSKVYCPYCTRVKQLFDKYRVPHNDIELDQLPDGEAMQDALEELTGQSTVPNVFVNGEHLGGCDSTYALDKQGKLMPKIKDLVKA